MYILVCMYACKNTCTVCVQYVEDSEVCWQRRCYYCQSQWQCRHNYLHVWVAEYVSFVPHQHL